MPEDPNLEDELLRRFQALKSTPTDVPGDGASSSFRATSDEQAKRAQEEDEELERIAQGRMPSRATSSSRPTDEDELRRRMAGLRGSEAEAEPDIEDDDAEVEAFIASLSGVEPPETISSPSSKALGSRTDQGRGLEREARDILRLTNRHLDPQGTGAHDEDKVDEEGYDDFETEAEIIQRAIDESRKEIGSESDGEEAGTRPPEKPEPDVSRRGNTSNTGAEQPNTREPSASRTSSPGLSFPSLPTHAPVDHAEDTPDDRDQEMDARMARLLGLSGPSTLPEPSVKLPSPPKEVKRQAGQGWNLPGYNDDRDDDPDSWCCICNQDADVICLGCDSDPYCERCWIEGHVGVRHRTKRFAGTGRKKAIGA